MTETSEIILNNPTTGGARWSDIALLKEGKINSVWMATKHGKRFILKGLREEFRHSTALQALLKKEFTIGAEIEHAGIVRTLDYAEVEGIGECIQIEYVDGRTLSDWLTENPTRGARRRVLAQLLEAVGYLHQKQILHRDLKPSNILVTWNGDNVRLIDFGIADADDYVAMKQAGGTRGYIAPEMIDNKEVDCRADIYAIGKIMQLVMPQRYRWIAGKCCRADREQRYANVEAVLRAMRREDALLYSLPVGLVVAGLMVCIGLQQSSILTMRESLNGYEEEERLIEDAVRRTDSIFDVEVEKPYMEGKFLYIQDVTAGVEKGRKAMEKLADDVENEALKAKIETTASTQWVKRYNRFVGENDIFKLPLRH